MLKKDDTYIFDIDNFDIMKVRDSTLLYCNRQCELVLVNKTGMSIVKKLNGNNTIEDIVFAISDEYGLPESVVKKYIYEFIERMIENKLIFRKDDTDENIEKQPIGISRVYLELVSDTLKRPLLQTEEILRKIIAVSKEKEILLFLNCEKLNSREIYDILSLIIKYTRFFIYIKIAQHAMDEDLIRLCSNNFKIKLIIPLFHSNEQQNDSVAQKGYYTCFFECVRQCTEKNVICYMGLQITENNKDVLRDLQQRAYDAGMTGIFLDDCDSEETDFLQELYQNNSFLNSWKNNRIKRRDNYFSILMYENFCQNSIGKLRKKKHCGIGWEELYIAIDDRVYPCHKLKIADLGYDSLDEYLERRERDFGEHVIAKKCRDCYAWSICLGGCRAKNINRGLSIDSVDENCDTKEKHIKKILFG